MYQQIKAELLDTATVGELKRKYPKWRESFYQFCANKRRWASWAPTEQLILPMEKTWMEYDA